MKHSFSKKILKGKHQFLDCNLVQVTDIYDVLQIPDPARRTPKRGSALARPRIQIRGGAAPGKHSAAKLFDHCAHASKAAGGSRGCGAEAGAVAREKGGLVVFQIFRHDPFVAGLVLQGPLVIVLEVLRGPLDGIVQPPRLYRFDKDVWAQYCTKCLHEK